MYSFAVHWWLFCSDLQCRISNKWIFGRRIYIPPHIFFIKWLYFASFLADKHSARSSWSSASISVVGVVKNLAQLEATLSSEVFFWYNVLQILREMKNKWNRGLHVRRLLSYIFSHLEMHLHIHTHANTNMHIIRVCMVVSIFVNVYKYAYINEYTYVCACPCMYLRVFVCNLYIWMNPNFHFHFSP